MRNLALKSHFSWQEGYGAFSYGKSQANQVTTYIQNQEKHPIKKTFIEEYEEFLNLFEIDYDQRYIFIPVNDYYYCIPTACISSSFHFFYQY